VLAFANPVSANIQVYKKEEFQVQAHENILFAGWNKPTDGNQLENFLLHDIRRTRTS